MSVENPIPVVAISVLVGAGLGYWPLAAWARGSSLQPTERSTFRIPSTLITAVSWGLATAGLGLVPALPSVLAFCAAATVLALVDLAEKRLPNRVILPTLALVGALLVGASAVSGDWLRLVWSLAGSVCMFGLYFLLALVAPNSMGMGDVKLAAVIGLVLGWFGFSVWLIGLLSAFVLGGVAAVLGLLLRRVTLRGSIPFGPSMLAGALMGLLVSG